MKKTKQWVGYVLLPIIILVAVALLHSKSISYYVLRKVAEHYAGQVNISLEIERITGSPLSKTTITGLSLRPAAGEPQTYQFRVESISCTYNLWDLKKGFYPFMKGGRCTTVVPEFSYDFRVDTPEDLEGEETAFFIPPILPGVDIEKGRVILVFEDGIAEFQGIAGSLRSAADADHELQVEVEVLRIIDEGASRIETGVAAHLHYSDAKLSIESFDAGEEQITAAGFIDLARMDEGYAELALDVLFGESKLGVSGTFDNQLVRAQIHTDNFDIGELQKRAGGVGWDITGTIRGGAELAYDIDSKEEAAGSFEFDVQESRVHGKDISTLVVKGDVAKGILRIAKAEAATSGNRLRVSNGAAPMGLVMEGRVLPILLGMQAEFSAEVDDWEALLELAALEDQILKEGFPLHSLIIEGSLTDGILRVVKADVEAPGNHMSLLNGALPVELLLDGKIFPILGGVQVEFGAEITDWQGIQKLLAPEDELLPAGLEPQRLSLNGRLADGVLYLDEARGEVAEVSMTINQGKVPVPADTEAFVSLPVSMAVRIESADLQKTAKLFTVMAVSGRAGVDMVIFGSVKEPRATIKLTSEQLNIKEKQLGTLTLQGEIQPFQDKPGSLKEARFIITEFDVANDYGSLALISPAEGNWHPGSFAASGAFQIDGDGEIAINIKQPQGQDLTAEITIRGVDSDGWLATFLAGNYFFHDADIEAAFAGLPGNPQVQLTGSMREAGWEGMPFPMSGRFGLQYSPKGVEISEFVWMSHGRNGITLTGFLPFNPLVPEPLLDGKLALNSRIDFRVLEDIGFFLEPLGIRKGSATLDVELTGTWNEPLGRVQLQGERIEVSDTLKEYFDAPINITCDLAAEPGQIVLHSASLESGVYTSQAAGTWQHGYTFAELLQKDWAELRGEVLLDASLRLKDLNFLRERLPWLRRIEGDTGVNLHVAGPVADPAIKGLFFLKNGELSHTYNLPMLSSVNLEGEFDTDSITITSMRGEAGGSPVTLSGRISRVTEGVDVNLRLGGSNVLLLRNNYMLLRGDIQLEVTGLLERLVIRGSTGLTGGYYSKNIDFLGKVGTTTAPVLEGGTFLFSFEEPPLKNAFLDIDITTIEPFRIRNNLVRSTLRPELSLKGTGELPFLVGVIYIDPSRVLLPSGRLQVQSGLMRFLEKDPDRPEIDLVASSKVLDYDINVVMQGSLDEPVYTLSSSPALPNDDLLLLLLTGQPPKDEEVAASGTLGRGTTNVMVYLGRDFLTKWLEEDAITSEESILERFELDYGRAVTKSGEQTIESTFRLSEKEVGEKRVYYLSGEKDRYDAYNYGLKVVFRFE
jgi:hypothetical protein